MSSPAGAASGASSGGDGGEAQQGEAQAAQGPDVGALAAQLGQMSEGQEQMRQFLMSQPWSQQEAQQENGEGAGGEPEALDLSFLDDAGYDQQTATALADVMQRQVQTQVEAAQREWQQQHQALNERVSEREKMEHMRDLVDEFPDMANPEIAQQVVQQAHQLTQANGWPAEMAADPRFWRIAYAAQQMFAQAQEEGSEQPDAAHLEGGAGAASAGGQQGDDFTQMLDAAGEGGRKVLPFG